MAHIKSRKHALAPSLATPARLHPCATAALTLLALPAAVYAQQAPAPASAASGPSSTATLPEVKAKAQAEVDYKVDVMSSPKFTQPLVDTPQTITVISKEILKQQVATSLTEALRNTPGVTIQLGENGNTQTGDSIFLRGFDTSASIFVDGIRDLGSISRDVFNIESVEVVKGPSGSDNGRGTSSGYVNLVSKTAQRERSASGTITLGTADRKRITADLNQPLDLAIPGTAVRLNVMAQDYGVPGRDSVKNKRWGIAPSLAFGLGTDTSVNFNYLHLEQKSRPDGGVSTYGLPGYIFSAGTPGTTPPVPAQASGAAVDSSTYYGLDSDYDDVSLDMFTAKIEHKLAPGYTLRNTTRLGRTEQTVVVTGVNAVTALVGSLPSTYTVARSRQGRHQNNEILTNQTNLTSEFATGPLKHSLSTGFEFIYERQRTETPTTVAGTANLYSPNSGDTMAMPASNGSYTRGSTLTAAVYAFDTLKLSEAWMLNGGVRLERFNTETNSATFTATPAPGTLVQNAPLGVTDNLFSWKVGALFKPASNGSIYATYSLSKNPPGGTNFSLSATQGNQAGPTTDPQEGTNIELGTKWDLLNGKLAATAAIYRAENKKEILSDGATPPNFAQIGKRRVDGVELGLVGQVTPAFNLSAGLSYMDSEILQGTAANTGGVIVFTPKVAFTTWATYKLPMGITLGGGARYVDTVARNSNTTAQTGNLLTSSDYWVFDAMASYEVTKNLTLQLNIANLFDKEYVSSLNNGGSRYKPGEERNALLSANFQF